MDHKYKSLLRNTGIRHIITNMTDRDELLEQIEYLIDIDLNNFFVLGNLTTIENVIGKFI